MLLSCYFIVLVLFSELVWYFGYNSVLPLFIYLSFFIIIILFRLNHFCLLLLYCLDLIILYILIIIIYLYIINFYLKNDELVKLIFFSIF